MNRYCVYYKMNNGSYRIIDSKTKEIRTINSFELKSIQDDVFIYELLKFNENSASDDELRKQLKIFKQWANELKDNDIFSIDILQYRSFNYLVYQVADRLCNNLLDRKIGALEASYMNRCNNSGIKYCENGYTGKSFAHDYSMNYPHIMASEKFMYPTASGKEQTIDELPTDCFNMPHGFYHVKIESSDKNFNKIFSYSKYDIYLHESLKTAMRYQKQFNVKIELYKDGEPNCYLYNKSDLVSGKKVFGKWFKVMKQLKEKFPENALVKSLASSLHGVLSTGTKKRIPIKDVEKFCESPEYENYELLDVKEFGKNGDRSYYIYKRIDKPFIYNIRIKPWIHAYARNKISRLVLVDIDNVIRVNVDCAVFKTDVITKLDKSNKKYNNLDLNNLKLEKDYTGYGTWHHYVKFEKL